MSEDSPVCPRCSRETKWVCEIDSAGGTESRRPAMCDGCTANAAVEAAMEKLPACDLDYHAPKRGGSR